VESSPSPNGLPYRWIPKFCIFFGLFLLLICVLINLVRLIIMLKNNKYIDFWKLPSEK
jgi:TRAP-type mannitol/chloroaromatic compound transport system permease small subunit